MYLLQKIRLKKGTLFDKARGYFSIVSAIGGYGLSPREIDVLAYIAINEGVEGFVEKYGSSKASVANIVSKLKKFGLVLKEDGVLKVDQRYRLDFGKKMILQIFIENAIA